MIKKIALLVVVPSFMTYAALPPVPAGTSAGKKEIELKISIDQSRYAQVEKWLNAHGCDKGESVQTEYYLTSPSKPWDESAGFKDALETLRVRLEEKGDSVCYKKRHLDPETRKTTHRDEYETNVQFGTVMLTILEKLGHVKTLIQKKRRTWLVEEKFEVVLDEVQGIGKFVEVELKTPVDNPKAGIAEIEDLLRRMEIMQFTQYDRGYIHMAWNPGYNFGETRNLDDVKGKRKLDALKTQSS